MLLLWGAVLGFVYRSTTGENGSTFAILALLVVSHWVLGLCDAPAGHAVVSGWAEDRSGIVEFSARTVAVEVAMHAAGVRIHSDRPGP
jgi:hypothetical protein